MKILTLLFSSFLVALAFADVQAQNCPAVLIETSDVLIDLPCNAPFPNSNGNPCSYTWRVDIHQNCDGTIEVKSYVVPSALGCPTGIMSTEITTSEPFVTVNYGTWQQSGVLNGLIQNSVIEVTVNATSVSIQSPSATCSAIDPAVYEQVLVIDAASTGSTSNNPQIPSTVATSDPRGIHINGGTCGRQVMIDDFVPFIQGNPNLPVFLRGKLEVVGVTVNSTNDWIIGEGSRIHIGADAQMNFSNNSISNGACCILWEGIILSGDGSLNFNNTTISDAVYAIHPLGDTFYRNGVSYDPAGGSANISNSTFENNFVGIQSEFNEFQFNTFTNNSFTSPMIDPWASECLPAIPDFVCQDEIVIYGGPPAPGYPQTMTTLYGYSGMGYSGIVLNETLPFTFTGANHFFDIFNGIRMDNTDLSINVEDVSTFENILASEKQCFDSRSGFGIAYNASGRPSSVAQSNITTCSFDNVDIGISLVDTRGLSNISTTECNFNLVWNGITHFNQGSSDGSSVFLCKGNTIGEQGSDMQPATGLKQHTLGVNIQGPPSGIIFSTFAADPSCDIVDNTVNVNINSASGIRLIESPLTVVKSIGTNVVSNNITLLDGTVQNGVRVERDNHAFIADNTISQGNGTGNFDIGINLFNGNSNRLCANTIDIFNNINTRGVQIDNEDLFSCSDNVINGADVGIRILRGTNSGVGNISGNIFGGTQTTSIHHVSGAMNTAGDQDFKGNYWTSGNNVNIDNPIITDCTDIYHLNPGSGIMSTNNFSNSSPDYVIVTVPGQYYDGGCTTPSQEPMERVSFAPILSPESTFEEDNQLILNAQAGRLTFQNAPVGNEYTLFDISGRQIITVQVNSSTFSIDLPSLTPGLYFARNHADASKSQSFIVN